MPPVKSIKLSIIYGAVLGASIVCSTAFAQSLTGAHPTHPGPHPGSKLVPHPHSEPVRLVRRRRRRRPVSSRAV